MPDFYTAAGRRRACRDHRDGLRDHAIRFSWPGGEGAPGNTLDTRSS